MIRHDLHGSDGELVLLRYLGQISFDLIVQPSGKDRLPVFGAPDDMILQRIDITATIRQFKIGRILIMFIHVYIIPYVLR